MIELFDAHHTTHTHTRTVLRLSAIKCQTNLLNRAHSIKNKTIYKDPKRAGKTTRHVNQNLINEPELSSRFRFEFEFV